MIKNLLLLTVGLLLFTGCLTKELPSYTIYSLQLNESNTSIISLQKSIRITQPQTIRSLNSNDILYIKDNLEQNAYALSQWSDKPAKMLQAMMTEKLSQNTQSFVTSSNMKQSSHYTLKSELHKFHQKFEDSRSYVLLELRVYLINNKTNEVKFKTFKYQKPSLNNAFSGVKMLNTLSNQFVNDLNQWIVSIQ